MVKEIIYDRKKKLTERCVEEEKKTLLQTLKKIVSKTRMSFSFFIGLFFIQM